MKKNKIPVVGFIGVGSIGKPMAERILDTYSVVVSDASPAALSAFEGTATVVNSAREVADAADIVFACLPSLETYEKVVIANDGLLAGKRMRHFVHVGTTGPDLVDAMNEALSVRGITMLDAPVSGGPARAKAAELAVMASGPRELFKLAEPIIRCYANSVVYFGDKPGLAQTIKLINNVLSAANLAVACEVMVLGVKAGLDPKQMLELVNKGTGANSATLTKIPNHLMTRKFDYGGRLELVQKDLGLFVKEAEKLGLNSPISTLVNSIYRHAMELEGVDGDMTEVIRHMERAAGVQIGP